MSLLIKSIFFLTIQCFFCVKGTFIPDHARNGELWSLIETERSSLFGENTSSEQWFSQQLDHFNITNKETFQQRFYETNTFWKSPNGPILLYIGGEGTLAKAPTGFIEVLAEKFGAKILALEHRFYGNSIPNNDLSSENLQYLTVQQALADLKHFKETYQKTNISSKKNKWIAIGGSYPGALSAWFRIAYPNTTIASLASSAVVNPVYKFWQFDEQVGLSVGEKCAKVLRQTTLAYENAIKNGNGTQVKSLMGAQDLCDADFFYMIADSAAMAVQYGHKDKVCNHMLDALVNQKSLIEEFASFTNKYYGNEFGSGCFYDTNCLARDDTRWFNHRSWRWQKCYQLAYFQIAPQEKSIRSSIVNLDYHETQCKKVFGNVVNPSEGVKEIKKLYGADHPKGHRIYFSNGADDPWQRASVLSSLSQDEVANLAKCDLCGHCGDLGGNSSTTPAYLQAQRREIIQYFTKWLQQAHIEEEKPEIQLQPSTKLTNVKATGSSYRSSPLVLVPIAFAFLALIVILHVDIVRDARGRYRPVAF